MMAGDLDDIWKTIDEINRQNGVSRQILERLKALEPVLTGRRAES